MHSLLSLKNAVSIPKNSLKSSFIVANAFVWYVSAFSYLQYLTSSDSQVQLIVAASSFMCLVISAFGGKIFLRKFQSRIDFLKYWTVAALFFSIPLALVNSVDLPILTIVACLIGAYFGLGMPICMAHYAKMTTPENRAKSSGLIILIIGIGFPAISTIGSSPLIVATVLAVWRFLSILPLLTDKSDPNKEVEKQQITYRAILSDRAFLLYALPWLMFSLINDLTMNSNNVYFNNGNFTLEFAQNYMLIENIIAGASAIICGIWADRKGRKRLALVAFALLGVGYASLGLFSNQSSTQTWAAIFYICVDGFAWGAFSMLFIATVWGDIAQERNAEKYYLLGVLPYLLSNLTRIAFGGFIQIGSENMVFSFASFFLFLAILPLAYAPETLADKIIKKVDINSYIEKALQKAKKDQ